MVSGQDLEQCSKFRKSPEFIFEPLLQVCDQLELKSVVVELRYKIIGKCECL